MWPANLTDAFDYLHIEITKYKPIAVALASAPENTTTPSSNTGSTFLSTGYSNIQSRFAGESLGQILLPVPENLNYADSPTWNVEEIGAVGKGVPAIAGEMMRGDSGGAAAAISQLANAGKVGVVMDMVKKLTAATGNTVSTQAITQGLGGKILNPYQEQVFQGIGMRSFDLNWKLVPRSQSEQIKIKDLIKKLRINALPNYASGISAEGDAGGVGDRWLEVPNIYNLSWKTIGGSELKSLPKIKPCICKGVQVSYTPNNVWATHMVNGNEPYPVAYDLTLQFQETEIIIGKDVEGGY
jgi:hypothetical protein